MAGNCDSGYSCVYEHTLSWRNATSPLPTEVDPKLVFDRLFSTRPNDPDRAKRNRRSMEEEVRDILRNAVNEEEVLSGGLGTEISKLFAKTGLDSDIEELRGNPIKPASFER